MSSGAVDHSSEAEYQSQLVVDHLSQLVVDHLSRSVEDHLSLVEDHLSLDEDHAFPCDEGHLSSVDDHPPLEAGHEVVGHPYEVDLASVEAHRACAAVAVA